MQIFIGAENQNWCLDGKLRFTHRQFNSEEFIKQHEFARRQVELCTHYFDLDPHQGARTVSNEKANAQALQDKLDVINREHGDAYISSIQPVFEPLMARRLTSSWKRI